MVGSMLIAVGTVNVNATDDVLSNAGKEFSDASMSNDGSSFDKIAYLQLLNENLSKEEVGTVVRLEDGFYKVLSRNLVLDNENLEASYIDTEYEKINPFRWDQETSEYASSKTHTYSNNGRTVTATVYAKFSYSSSNNEIPEVVSSRYSFSDSDCFKYKSMDETHNIFTKTRYVKLSYDWLTSLSSYGHSITVSCLKNGSEG